MCVRACACERSVSAVVSVFALHVSVCVRRGGKEEKRKGKRREGGEGKKGEREGGGRE